MAAAPPTYAAGFERAPRPAAGTATARSRGVRLDDGPCGTEPKRTLLCDKRRGREKSKQRELAAAAERASCPTLTPCRTRMPCPAACWGTSGSGTRGSPGAGCPPGSEQRPKATARRAPACPVPRGSVAPGQTTSRARTGALPRCALGTADAPRPLQIQTLPRTSVLWAHL